MRPWPTCGRFASWLGVCTHNDISGGRVLKSRTQKTKNRANAALRLAAQSLTHSNSWLGTFYRRQRARLGAAKAITATAHKLARIYYHLVTTKEPYDESIFAKHEARHQQRRLERLKREAASFGLTLIPKPEAALA